MKKFVLAFLCGICGLNGLSWQTPELIAPRYYASNYALFGTYDSATQQVFVAWDDSSSAYPYYSTFTSGGWATPIYITTTSQPFGDVVLNFNPTGANASQVVASFSDDANMAYPTSYFYTSSWGSDVVINNSSNTTGDVFQAFDPTSQSMYASWTDSSTSNPTFAVCNNNTPTWSSIPSLTSSADSDVTIVCDNSGNLYAAWVVSGVPYYAIFNGTNWTNPAEISSGYSNGIQNRVFLTFDALNNQVFAAWADLNRNFTYSIYSNGSWLPQAITLPDGVTDIQEDVYLVYASVPGVVVASWASKGTGSYPTYAVYNGLTQTWDVAPISTSANAADLTTLVYNEDSNTLFAFWIDNSGNPYSTTSFAGPASISHLTGRNRVNDFGTESEVFASLSWTASPSKGVLGYRVYEDGALIAVLGPTATQYSAHNQTNGTHTFTIVAFNNSGDSAPVSITIR